MVFSNLGGTGYCLAGYFDNFLSLKRARWLLRGDSMLKSQAEYSHLILLSAFFVQAD